MGGKNEGDKIMQVKVLFFGVLAEVASTNCKHYRDVNSIGDLKLRIQDDFPEIVHFNFRISLNNEILNIEPLLHDGDEVALMPPFAGG
jgi:sulfur-carrier protein